MNQFQQLPVAVIPGGALLREKFLHRTQHEGQRGPQFMAHIGEEYCLGAIDLGERFPHWRRSAS